MKKEAKELYKLFYKYTDRMYRHEKTKKCALICVNKLIKSNKAIVDNLVGWDHDKKIVLAEIQYWQEIKKEIKK